jgi:hypothetical protein
MGGYAMRWIGAMALVFTLVPAVAAAAPLITVGVNVPIPGPVIMVRPAPPAYGWMWVDGGWRVNQWGHRHYVSGYWAPPPRPVVYSRVAPVVVHHRAVVARPAPRRVIVRR